MKSVNMNILLIPKVLLLDVRRLPIHQKVPLSALQVSTSHLWKMHTGPWLASKLCDVTKPCLYEHVKLCTEALSSLTNVRSVKHTTDSSLIALGLMYFVTPYSYTAECKQHQQDLQSETQSVLPDNHQMHQLSSDYQKQHITALLRTALQLILSLTSLSPHPQPIKVVTCTVGTLKFLERNHTVWSLMAQTKWNTAIPHRRRKWAMTAWLKLCFPQQPPVFMSLLDD